MLYGDYRDTIIERVAIDLCVDPSNVMLTQVSSEQSVYPAYAHVLTVDYDGNGTTDGWVYECVIDIDTLERTMPYARA